MPVQYTFGSATSAIPLSQLDTNFATTITLGNTAIQLGNTVTTLNNMTLANVTVTTVSGASANAVVYTNSSGQVTANSSVIALDTSGNLGLGVTPSTISLGKSLEVAKAGSGLWNNGSQGDIQLVGNYYYNSGDKFAANGYAQAFILDSGVYSWRTSSANNGSGAGAAATMNTLMTLDASGNLGIGTTSPTGGANRVVDVYGSGSSAINFHNATSGTTSTDGGVVGQYGSDLVLYNYEAGIIQFGTSNAERARITSSGGLWVGTTTRQSTSNSAFIQTTAGDWTANFQCNTSTASSNLGALIYYSASAPNGLSAPFLQCSDNAQNRLIIYSNGTVNNWTGGYAAFSDIKLKENIVDTTPKLEKLMKVRIRNYNLIGDDTKMLGVVAQELESVFPNMIDELPDYEEVTTTDEEGNETTERVATGTTTKSVKYSIFVPMLIKAMQEQQAIITQLQADVAALKGTK